MQYFLEATITFHLNWRCAAEGETRDLNSILGMKFTFARFSVSLLPPIPRWRYWSSGIVGRIFLKMIFFCCLITFACCDTEEEEMWKMTPVTYLCISAHLKNLTFLSFEFGNRQYTFYPQKLSRLAKH